MKNSNCDFDKIFNLMQKSFPEAEYREYAFQKLLTKNNLYTIDSFTDHNDELIAFMTVWNLKNFKFIEHLAVDEKCRGMGIGTKIMKNFIEKNSGSEIILEIEPPVDTLTIRRLNFYKRLGFAFNEYTYFQPPMRKNFEKVKLNILSYPEKLSIEKFEIVKNEIHSTAYSHNF